MPDVSLDEDLNQDQRRAVGRSENPGVPVVITGYLTLKCPKVNSSEG